MPIRGLTALALLAMTIVPSLAQMPAPGAALTVPPAGYAYQPAPPCLDNAERAEKPIRPGAAVYKVCADQMAIFGKGLADAKASGKLLLVTLGATWCPYCASLQKTLPSAEVLGRKGDALDYGAAFHHIEIGLSTIDKGAKAKIPSGEAVLGLILSQSPGVKIRAIPFMAVIEPTTGRVFARNLDDTGTQDGRHDMPRMRAVLTEAHAFVKGTAAAPDEPGWVKRKLLRWWQT